MSQQRQFSLALGILFPLSYTSQQSCWRAVRGLPEPHLSELIAALTRGAAQQQQATYQAGLEIASAIGRPEAS